MRNVSHEFFLVVLGTCNFAGHVGKGGAQITYLVLAFYLKFIMHISGGILLRGFGDFPQGQVYHFRKENQDNHGKQKQYNQHQVRNV